ncbi:hypothetical protein GQX74_011369 [Glossina fuscipes]|nr:hypothetical protein GQX74_011369 [Glossina fuscipes]
MHESPVVIADPFKRSTRIQPTPEPLGGNHPQERSSKEPKHTNEEWTVVQTKNGNVKLIKLVNKPDTIVIKQTGTTTYSDMPKRVKNDAELQKVGENVTEIQETLKGEMLLEFKQSAKEEATAYQQLVACVKLMTKQIKIEFKELVEVTSANDLIAAKNPRFSSLNIKKEAVIWLLSQKSHHFQY